MNKHNTTTNSLQRLYRSLCASRASAFDELDADSMLAAASGQLTPAQREAVTHTLANSPEHAATVLFLRELDADSAHLAAAGSVRSLGHARRARPLAAHSVSHRRRQHAGLRWLGAGVAAIMVCALGVWGWQQVPSSMAPNVASQQAAPEQDSIFHARMDGTRTAQHAVGANEDRIFSAGMHGGPVNDEIFSAEFKGQG